MSSKKNMPATLSLNAMLRNQVDDECNAVMELCKSDIESGPNQLALTTVIDNKEQVKIYLAEMQMRVLALEPTIGFIEIDPVKSTIIFGDEEHGVQITCVTGGALAVVTTMKEAKSLIVARTNTTVTLRVKNVYTDEMIESELDIKPNPHHPDTPMIRYISGVINLTGDPRGMKEIGEHMDICISLAVALLTTPVSKYHHHATAGRRCG